MPENEPSTNNQKLQLEIQKLAQEIEKLKVEIPKIRREGGWRATVMPSIVSIAAVLVTAVVSTASILNVRQEQNYDRLKSEREFAVSCVNSASAIAKLVFDKSDDFDKLQAAGKINFANVVLAAYPPPVADRFLRSLAPRLGPTDTESITAFQLAINRVEEQANLTEFPCPAVTDLIPVPSKLAPGPESGVLTPTSVASGTARSPLTTYYQVTRPADRAAALTVASIVQKDSTTDAATRFPSAGVEVVAGAKALDQVQVRYYRREQEDAAQQLLTFVQNALHQQGGRTVFIGNTFPNLPPGKIEVWFAPFESASK